MGHEGRDKPSKNYVSGQCSEKGCDTGGTECKGSPKVGL